MLKALDERSLFQREAAHAQVPTTTLVGLVMRANVHAKHLGVERLPREQRRRARRCVE